MGGSGSGKSTLLRLMIGNIPYDGGDIIAFGKSLTQMSDKELDDYRKSVGVLFQSGAVQFHVGSRQRRGMPLRGTHRSPPRGKLIEIVVKMKLEQVGLHAPTPTRCRQCSPAE